MGTDESWKTWKEDARTLVPDEDWDYRLGPQFLSLNEIVDGRKLPDGWETTDFDDGAWSAAVPATPQRKMSPIVDPWRLFPRNIPVLPEVPSQFDGVVRCSDPTAVESWKGVLSGSTSGVEVPAGTSQWVEIETNTLTTGFLDLIATSTGDNKDETSSPTKIEILYSECYETPAEPGKPRHKGDRTDYHNGCLYGMTDTYTLRGGANHYSPFWFRTFRYIRLTITTTPSSSATVTSLAYRATHYPLQVSTTITTTDTLTRKLWDTSLTTLRNCMHETYEDCPFYEQNQFAMDTRLLILLTYLLSRDDRLARKALHEFHASRREDGLIETHFPCPSRATTIPTFSLFWVLSVWDHMVFFGDLALVREYIGTVDGVLGYFDRHLDGTTGLVGRFEDDCWAFVDWVFGPGWMSPEKGFFGMAVPRAYFTKGSATYHSLVYAYALAKAAELNTFAGRHDTAREYLERRDALVAAVRTHCFDPATGFFLDGPRGDNDNNNDAGPGAGTNLSQHVQIFAVLAGCMDNDQDGEQAKRQLVRRTILQREEYGLAKASFALGFYLFRAAAAVGVYDECWPALIAPWETMLAQNLTTWAESEFMVRSDCHGWSSTPLWEIATEVLGVQVRSQAYLDRVVKASADPSDGTVAKVTAVLVEPRTGLVRGQISADVLVRDGGDGLIHIEASEGQEQVTISGI